MLIWWTQNFLFITKENDNIQVSITIPRSKKSLQKHFVPHQFLQNILTMTHLIRIVKRIIHKSFIWCYYYHFSFTFPFLIMHSFSAIWDCCAFDLRAYIEKPLPLICPHYGTRYISSSTTAEFFLYIAIPLSMVCVWMSLLTWQK